MATLGSLLASFFFFFFFFFSLCFSALSLSVSLSHLLLGEPVRCFLTGGSAVLSGIRSFLLGVCSPFYRVSLMGIFLNGVFFEDTSRNRLCWNCANRDAIEPLGCVFWPLGVLCFFARDGGGGGGGVSSHGGLGGSCGNVGNSGVLDDWASNLL